MQESSKRAVAPGSFGQYVRRQRDEIGWTQQQLSDRLASIGPVKLDTSAITRIENGSREPRLSEAQAIAAALGVQLDELLPSDASPLRKLWLDLDDAGFGLLDAVYEYGVRRRALNEALQGADVNGEGDDEADPFIRKILGMDELQNMRDMAKRKAIGDWTAIRADHGSRSRHNPPRDESVFDAET